MKPSMHSDCTQESGEWDLVFVARSYSVVVPVSSASVIPFDQLIIVMAPLTVVIAEPWTDVISPLTSV